MQDTVSYPYPTGNSTPAIGSFSLAKRAASKGRNPQTSEIVKIKTFTVPKCKASANFKKVVAKQSDSMQTHTRTTRRTGEF